MSFRLDMLKETVAWAEKLEDYGTKATIRLDDKAQQTGGIAGLFLAAAFGFSKPETFVALGKKGSLWAWAVLFAIIAVLLVCLGCCLSVTWLRSTPMPIGLTVLQGLMNDLLEQDEARLDDTAQENYFRDRLRIWETIVEDRLHLNKNKARRLFAAQCCLATGMLLAGLLLCCAIVFRLHH